MTTLKPQTTFSDLITPTTVYSLLAMTAIITFAILSSRLVLPRHASLKTRFLFIWHAFDFTTHFAIEAPYLYNCFYTFLPINSLHSSSLPALLPGLTRPIMAMTPPGTYFKNEPSRLYGAFYGEGVTAKLWQEYARADRRWGGADLGIVSLELLTCGVMAPLAVAVCVLLARGKVGAAWFWAAVVATGELYGGFMTFAPEWLSGSPNLDTSNWMYLWLYLVFFNTLWVFVPIWVLWQAYSVFTGAMERVTVTVEETRGEGKKRK